MKNVNDIVFQFIIKPICKSSYSSVKRSVSPYIFDQIWDQIYISGNTLFKVRQYVKRYMEENI